MDIPKILIPSKEVIESGWNKHIPNPLAKGEKCILSPEQGDVEKNYVRVKHGVDKRTSVFHLRNFTDLKGNQLHG